MTGRSSQKTFRVGLSESVRSIGGVMLCAIGQLVGRTAPHELRIKFYKHRRNATRSFFS